MSAINLIGVVPISPSYGIRLRRCGRLSSMARMLDDELLGGLDRRWREQSPALLERIAPGLSDEEIDRLAEPLGVALPEEVRRWFRWQDGSAGRQVIFARAFYSLRTGVKLSLEFVADDERIGGWLQALDEKPYVFFDCRGDLDQPAPVWHFEYSFDFDRPTRPVFDSIGDMVAFWIELIDGGHVSWDAAGDWVFQESMPEAARRRVWGVPTD
jgi:hypothetical protein